MSHSPSPVNPGVTGTAPPASELITLNQLIQDQAAKTVTQVLPLEVNRTVTAGWAEEDAALAKLSSLPRDSRSGGFHPIPEPDDQLAAAVLPMISDWQWMRRRVDSLQLIANGQTRRRLSFDFELPHEEALRYGKGSDQVMVPLTFLRKGMLINLDLEFNGESTSSMQMSRNGHLPFQALRLLADELSLSRHLLEVLDVPWTERQANLLIRQGILDIIYDLRCHPSAEFEDLVYPVQEGHRHQLFAALALAASHQRSKSDPHLTVADIDLSFWVLEAGQLIPGGKVVVEGTNVEEGSVLDSSLPVQCLALAILQALSTSSGYPDREHALRCLEIMCCLLSTMSISYLFSVVVDADAVWTGAGNNVVPRRALAKLTCDAEQSSFNDPEEAEKEFLSNPNLKESTDHEQVSEQEKNNRKIRRVSDELERLTQRSNVHLRPKRVIPYTSGPEDWAGSMNLAYSTLTASSTHLEIQPPEGANLIAMYGLVTHEDDLDGEFSVPEARGYLEPGTPSCKRLIVPGGGESGAVDKQMLDRFRHRMGKRHPHGTSRPSQSRVHVYNPSPERSLEWLRVWFAPTLGASPLAAAWLMLLSSAAACLMFADRVLWNGVLDLSNLLDINAIALPLLLALFGFMWFTTGTHRLAREIHATAKLHVVWSAVVSMLVFLLPLVAMLLDESNGPPKCYPGRPQHVYPPYDIIIGFLLVAFVVHGVLVLIWVHKYERFCNHDYENKEYIIRSVLLDGTLQREAISVMETGAWDVEYLTDRYCWFYAGKFDIREYLRDLQATASEVAAKVPKPDEEPDAQRKETL